MSSDGGGLGSKKAFTALVVGFFALISEEGAQVALDANCQNTHAPSSMSLRRCCQSLRCDLHGLNKRFITLDSRTLVETDASGILLKPTWSVHNLISSYPKPTTSSATFKCLHELFIHLQKGYLSTRNENKNWKILLNWWRRSN